MRTSAVNHIGQSNSSMPISCAILPGIPVLCEKRDSEAPSIEALAIGSVGADRVQLVWETIQEASISLIEIQRDDWWRGAGLETVETLNGTALEGKSYVLSGLLPATAYRLRARAKYVLRNVGSLQASPWSDIVRSTTKTRGACGDSHNLPMQKTHFNTLKTTVQWCILTALGNADRASACISSKIGFTDACSRCWVDEGKCAASKCPACLTSPAGQPCEDCCLEKCFPPLVQCTGLPDFVDPR